MDQDKILETNLRLYTEEIAPFTDQLDSEVLRRFLQGEEALQNEIAHSCLKRTVQLAKKYEKRAQMDEIIAQGNVGLMLAIHALRQNSGQYMLADGSADVKKAMQALEAGICQAMEEYIDEETGRKDQMDTVVAKTNLLHEAEKYMAEEIGRLPTMDELSEYTKMNREEIRAIKELSKQNG